MGFDFPVEPGRILSFARSVGDDDPAYRAQLYAAPRGRTLVTPPTFVRTADHYDPDRTRAGQEGFGAPDGTGGFVDGANAVHAEQHFEYLAPFRAGDRVHVETTPGRTWTKHGRSGRLEFYETLTEFRNDAGDVLVRARKVSVRLPGRANA